MKCAATFLAWTIGVPLAFGAFAVAFAGWMFAWAWIAQAAGFSEGVGFGAGLIAMLALMGACFGIAECRERSR